MTCKDVSLHDMIETDKQGNEITLIDILGMETNKEKEKLSSQVEQSKLEIVELLSNIGDTEDKAVEDYLYKHLNEIRRIVI